MSVHSKAVSGVTFIEAGADEAIVPALWGQGTFIQKAGGSEVIGQMWAFPDKKGRPCCLIPEVTALFQERRDTLLGKNAERMFFYIARCYRYERPQAGRYREFVQLGFEYLCADPEKASVRSQQIAVGFLDSLGVRYGADSAADVASVTTWKAGASKCAALSLAHNSRWWEAGLIARVPASPSARSVCCSR